MKKLLLSAFIFLPLMASAYNATFNGIYYFLDNKTHTAKVTYQSYEILSSKYGDLYVYHSDYSGNVEIPATVKYLTAYETWDTYDVTSIDEHAFEDCTELTSVTIPNSVTSIGGSAFKGCSSLTSISIPHSVTSIGGSAFYCCSALSSITIPNNLTSINISTFNGCSSLTSIKIPNNVTSIGENAFAYCNGLTSITIPNSVTSIGYSAFRSCSGLTSVTIPNSVTSIGGDAFYNCSNLTSVTIPNSVTSLGQGVFYDTGWYNNQSNGILYLDNWLIGYKGDKPTGKIVVSEGTKGIAGSAFMNCSNLTSITIPKSVKIIGGGAFRGCSGLTSITIPNSVTSIGGSAFYDCSGLTSITISDIVTSIEVGVFSGCTDLTSFTIPNSVTNIGDSAFRGCSGLTSVTIGKSVTSIGNNAFVNCSRLTDVTCLAETVPKTSSSAFYTSSIINSFVEKATLHVPESAIDAYKTKEPWSKFRTIEILESKTTETSETTETHKCATPTITLENGKVKFGCETEGVNYISSISAPDAKNYNDSELSLSYKYKISVYATKSGYVNSDTATREIIITDSGKVILVGDLDGNGVVNVADHVKLSDIIMNQ